MRASAKTSDQQALYAAALCALTRRAHSIFEMKTYLERRASSLDAVKQVLARMREQRLLDDSRYAVEFARNRVQMRRQGRYRIARELRARGVSDEHIDAALAQVLADTDEGAVVRKLIERRLQSLRGTFDARKAASLYRTLLRSGFDAALIRSELRTIRPDGADSLPTEDA